MLITSHIFCYHQSSSKIIYCNPISAGIQLLQSPLTRCLLAKKGYAELETKRKAMKLSPGPLWTYHNLLFQDIPCHQFDIKNMGRGKPGRPICLVSQAPVCSLHETKHDRPFIVKDFDVELITFEWKIKIHSNNSSSSNKTLTVRALWTAKLRPCWPTLTRAE